MCHHYHALIETPEPNPVAGTKWLQGIYTQRYNSRHKVFGHLFQGRYKALPVEGGLAHAPGGRGSESWLNTRTRWTRYDTMRPVKASTTIVIRCQCQCSRTSLAAA